MSAYRGLPCHQALNRVLKIVIDCDYFQFMKEDNDYIFVFASGITISNFVFNYYYTQVRITDFVFVYDYEVTRLRFDCIKFIICILIPILF